ncbi:hypothetical protein L6164_034172 [Bauhinia variegata]|uniref:Uncharacterized protein n=1 Tax=Bauhinia variegata TaxID=167791 RepID=A0ACB9KU48_BAUVA|nr:hypothetical protein L6164_034172 [Bauhinia variegata]
MAPKRKPKSSSPIHIGNCKVTVEANTFTCKSDSNSIEISVARSGKIKISVAEDAVSNDRNDTQIFKTEDREHEFVLVNPKDADDISKTYRQEVLQMYRTELPGMNFAANTGKQSKFLERCVNNGKFRTLLLKSSSVGNCGKNNMFDHSYWCNYIPNNPADTEYAEIPLAAVCDIYQRKGLGHQLFLELRKRLKDVGIRSIFCWGDQESEGFWLKQGFVSIAKVDTKGRARRLPIKADIRKALCFPGGSTLMIHHLRKDLSADSVNSIKDLPSQLHQKYLTSAIAENERREFSGVLHIELKLNTENDQPEALVKDGFSSEYDQLSDGDALVTGAELSKDGIDTNMKHCSQSTKGEKRAWEASLSSLKSKRVKGSHLADCRSDSRWGFISQAERTNSCLMGCSKEIVESPHGDSFINTGKYEGNYLLSEDPVNKELPSTEQCFRLMLMNIADDTKITYLTKVIQGLGGVVTTDGVIATHVVTGKVRRTLNFCTALCSGAWVVSSSWLKVSFREGRFVDELPYILNDKDYKLKYRADLKSAVLRTKATPQALLKGYNVFIAPHVQPSAKQLSAIVRSAGGNVICQLDKVNETSGTLFVACEEDMEEAMMAVKKGIRTFSSEWFMNCVMRQELDLEATQFAESL